MSADTHILAVVQARMSSKRLPGKVLRMVNGRPLLAHLFERLCHCNEINDIVVATSVESSDDVLAEFARSSGIICHRGPLDDVAARMLGAARAKGADAFVRISGDSPLLDGKIVDRMIAEFRKNPSWDLVTNVQERTFPKGQSVEVVSVEAMSRAYGIGLDTHEREHVTPHFYAHPEQYAILNIQNESRDGDLQLSVDTEQDMQNLTKVLNILGKPFWKHDLRATVRAMRQLQETAGR